MPCIFCIAVFMIVAGTIAASAIDHMQGALETKSGAPVRKTAESDSVAKLETTFRIEGKLAPVAVTVYKNSGRARIQILTHELSAAGVRSLQDEIAIALGAQIVDRSDMSGSTLVREPPPASSGGDGPESMGPVQGPNEPRPRY